MAIGNSLGIIASVMTTHTFHQNKEVCNIIGEEQQKAAKGTFNFQSTTSLLQFPIKY